MILVRALQAAGWINKAGAVKERYGGKREGGVGVWPAAKICGTPRSTGPPKAAAQPSEKMADRMLYAESGLRG
jgi:hypothetical protein